MGIVDDGPYILMARHLAATGHIAYNGWATPMFGWQLYLGAAFIRLFGFSFTAARMSTLLVALALAWLLQRTLVRAGVNERNATIGTLALVLSPLYLMLSVTYMTDIFCLFAVVICLYGCLRALQASSDRSAIAWLCFAVAANAVCGTARQLAWFGVLVMVPSTLWLLRARRLHPSGPKATAGNPDRVLLAGSAATLAGVVFIFACMHWFAQQPYTIPEHLPKAFSVASTLLVLTYAFLDLPFLLLPITLLFFPQIRKLRPRSLVLISLLFVGYIFLATYPSHLRGDFQLLPLGAGIGLGEWNNVTGMFAYDLLKGEAPVVIGRFAQVLLTFATFGALIGLIVSLQRDRRNSKATESTAVISRRQLGFLVAPFSVAYFLPLISRAGTPGAGIRDRYLLEPLVVALLCLLRYYQERVRWRLPFAAIPLVAIVAAYSVAMTHNMFSLYRARVAIATELLSDGVPDTSVDNGWEANFVTELRYSNHINEAKIALPAHSYVPPPPVPAGACSAVNRTYTPHVHPIYGISFGPNACYGPAPFAPVHYSRWPYRTPGTLYVVRYLPPAKQYSHSATLNPLPSE